MTRGIICVFVLMVGCDRGDRVDERRGIEGDSAARAAAQPARSDSAARADSGGRRDTAAIVERAPAEDPPCFASHLGLPCQ
jgi:hypothetical protein